MKLNTLTAIGPVDGRYRSKTEALAPYFSEFGLIRYRVRVEVEYLIKLNSLAMKGFATRFTEEQTAELRSIYRDFTEEMALQIKETEKTTNHDVKAVEYFLKEQINSLDLSQVREWVHFGLTSQDINNTAIPLSIKEALHEVVMPELQTVIEMLEKMAEEYKDVPMLARTHGQAASPTRLGKEIMVFVSRLRAQYEQLLLVPNSAKFGGATGNFNAHAAAFPDVDWNDFGNSFVQELGLERSYPTTQIEHYDNFAALCDVFSRINTILTDLSRDIWQYISMDYFKQKLKAGEVGSSAMPHKVNPIDFENAEGNLGMANAVFRFLSSKLPVSRLQRDLTDSTVLRNIGIPFGHTLIACISLQNGLGKLILNREAIEKDLNRNWSVVAEAIQTVLRSIGYPNPYEALKELTRTNAHIGEQEIRTFIDSLDVPENVRERLRSFTPLNYTGI